MNLTTGRIFLSLKGRINGTLLMHREKVLAGLGSTVNSQTRGRTKFRGQNIFATDQQKYDYNHSDKEEKTGWYGYFLLGIPVSAFFLGTWQIQRRQWKLDLLENLNKRITMEPVELPENLDELDTIEYYPIKVKGSFLHDKEFTIGPKSLIVDGAGASEKTSSFMRNRNLHNGYYVITPFKLADRDLTILVNRGWVPPSHRKPQFREEEQVKGVFEIIGVNRITEHRPQFMPENNPKKGMWFYRDLNAMAEEVGTAPVYLEMLFDKNGPAYPVGGQTRINLRNEHFSYILTWYSLSAITGYMWYRQFIKKIPL